MELTFIDFSYVHKFYYTQALVYITQVALRLNVHCVRRR